MRRLARARKAPHDMVMRAQKGELSWQGHQVPAIAAAMGCGEKTARRWPHRFNHSGLQGLKDRGGQGRKQRITETERSRIISLIDHAPLSRPKTPVDEGAAPAERDPSPGWTLDTLAAEARRLGIDVGRSPVRRILPAEGMDWHRPRSHTRALAAARPTARRPCAQAGPDR